MNRLWKKNQHPERKVARSRHAARDIPFDAAFSLEKFSDAKVLHLCRMMQEKLPREPRDLIYGYISTHKNVYVQNYNDDDDPLDPSPAGETYCSLVHNRQVKKFSLAKLGYDTFHELVENYYRTSGFIFTFHDSWDIRMIRSVVFSKDNRSLGLHVDPAKFLSRVTIKLYARRVAAWCDPQKRFAIANLKALQTIRKGAIFQFLVNMGALFPNFMGRIRHLEKSVELLLPLFQEFSKDEYDVSLSVLGIRTYCLSLNDTEVTPTTLSLDYASQLLNDIRRPEATAFDKRNINSVLKAIRARTGQ